MNKLATNKKLAIVNFIIVGYFILIWLIYHFKIDFFLIGFFGELMTIPFLFAQIVFLFFGIKFLMKSPRDYLTMLSVFLLAICTIITFGSFFFRE